MIIYGITNLINCKIYVGQTIRNFSDRIREHCNENGKISAIQKAIKKYGKENFAFYVLQECITQEELNECELFWINNLNSMSPFGYNLTEGTSAGKRSDETRKKISDSKKGKPLSEEHRKKISNSGKGRIFSKETRKKLSDSLAGRICSDKHKKNISNALIGRTFTEETKKKMSKASTGRTHSEETRKKMSESIKVAMKGRKPSKETVKKTAISNTGKKRTEESKQKMKDAQIKRRKKEREEKILASLDSEARNVGEH